MRYVRVIDNVAIEIFDTPYGVSINDCFHPTIASEFVEAPESVVAGDILTGDGWASLQNVQPAPEQAVQLATEQTIQPAQPAPNVNN